MSYEHHEPVRGLFFWALSPFLVVFIVLMPLLIQKRDGSAMITLAAIELLAILMLLGLFHPLRFWWAWRGVGAIVFLGYAAYLIAMLIESGGKIAFTPRRSEASAFYAICGLIVFGVPGLWYAVLGRFSFRAEQATDEVDVEEDET
jgi:predicted ABC-type exoprotein transport system permease subunit